MQIHTVNAGQGWHWIADAFNLFKKNPLIWITLSLIFIFMQLGATAVPMLGPIIVALLTPVFYAGLMAGAKEVEGGGELELPHLFAGFKKNTAQLITVGGIYMVGAIVIFGLMMMLSGGTLLEKVTQLQELQTASTPDPEMAMQLGREMLTLLLPGLLLFVPLIMAYWFAPALVYFGDLKALTAMKLSFLASLKNVTPFLIYGLIMLVLMFIAAVTVLGLLVLIPLLIISLYTSYQNVFNSGSGANTV